MLTITAHRIWGSKGKECSSCEQTKTERALRDPEATALSRTKNILERMEGNTQCSSILSSLHVLPSQQPWGKCTWTLSHR